MTRLVIFCLRAIAGHAIDCRFRFRHVDAPRIERLLSAPIAATPVAWPFYAAFFLLPLPFELIFQFCLRFTCFIDFHIYHLLICFFILQPFVFSRYVKYAAVHDYFTDFMQKMQKMHVRCRVDVSREAEATRAISDAPH